MTDDRESTKQRDIWFAAAAAVITYVLTRIVFSWAGFHYDLFRRPLDLRDAAIDLGTWACVFAIAWISLRAIASRR